MDSCVDPAVESLCFDSVNVFFSDYLRWVYRRHIDGRQLRWAGRWWEYEEALIRLEALWRAWEFYRLNGATGVSEWFRDHADHHLPILMSEHGPFAAVVAEKENTNQPGDPLPHVSPPEGLFDGHQSFERVGGNNADYRLTEPHHVNQSAEEGDEQALFHHLMSKGISPELLATCLCADITQATPPSAALFIPSICKS